MINKSFINIHLWRTTKDLLTLLAEKHNMKVCTFMHQVAVKLAETDLEYRSIEDQDE